MTWFCWVILTRPSSFLGPKIHAKWGYLHDLPIEAAERNDCVTTSAAHRRLEKSSENMVNLVAPNLKRADHVFSWFFIFLDFLGCELGFSLTMFDHWPRYQRCTNMDQELGLFTAKPWDFNH